MKMNLKKKTITMTNLKGVFDCLHSYYWDKLSPFTRELIEQCQLLTDPADLSAMFARVSSLLTIVSRETHDHTALSLLRDYLSVWTNEVSSLNSDENIGASDYDFLIEGFFKVKLDNIPEAVRFSVMSIMSTLKTVIFMYKTLYPYLSGEPLAMLQASVDNAIDEAKSHIQAMESKYVAAKTESDIALSESESYCEFIKVLDSPLLKKDGAPDVVKKYADYFSKIIKSDEFNQSCRLTKDFLTSVSTFLNTVSPSIQNIELLRQESSEYSQAFKSESVDSRLLASAAKLLYDLNYLLSKADS